MIFAVVLLLALGCAAAPEPQSRAFVPTCPEVYTPGIEACTRATAKKTSVEVARARCLAKFCEEKR